VTTATNLAPETDSVNRNGQLDISHLIDPDAPKPDVEIEDNAIVREIVGAILDDDEVIRAAHSLVKASQFVNKVHGAIVGVAFDHFERYDERPSRDALTHELRKRHGKQKDWDHYPAEITTCLDLVGMSDSRAYLIEECRQIAQRSVVKKLLNDALDDLGKRKFDYGKFCEAVGAERQKLGGHTSSAYKFEPIDSATFANTTYAIEWLVKGMLVLGQPAVMGGAKKSMKTTTLIDLVISLATGLAFLGAFAVARKFRVAFVSGESGEFTIQETANRVCVAKGVPLNQVDCFWDFRLPKLSLDAELAELTQGIKKRAIEVVVIDPLYLCLLSGNNAQDVAQNMYKMGPLLLAVSRACLDAGATPILAHHTRMRLNNPHGPLDLEDLAFAGIQEFARQWLLLSRREAYQPGTGIHKMYLSYGGSVGHGGLKGLDIDEGVIDDEFRGRKWAVSVVSVADIKAAKQAKKEDAKEQEDSETEAQVVEFIRNCRQPTRSKLKRAMKWGDAKRDRIMDRLFESGQITSHHERVEIGSGAVRECEIFELVTDHRTIGTDHRHGGGVPMVEQ
jgi:hypothetical protein